MSCKNWDEIYISSQFLQDNNNFSNFKQTYIYRYRYNVGDTYWSRKYVRRGDISNTSRLGERFGRVKIYVKFRARKRPLHLPIHIHAHTYTHTKHVRASDLIQVLLLTFVSDIVLYLFPGAAAYIAAAVFAYNDDFGNDAMRFLSDKSIYRRASKQVNQRGVTTRDTESHQSTIVLACLDLFCENTI